MFVGANVRGRKRPWAQMSVGANGIGANVQVIGANGFGRKWDLGANGFWAQMGFSRTKHMKFVNSPKMIATQLDSMFFQIHLHKQNRSSYQYQKE